MTDDMNHLVKSMRVVMLDRKRSAAVYQYLSRARELQATNEVEQAFSEVEKGRAAYPGDARLIQLHAVLAKSLEGSLKQSQLRRDRSKMLDIRRNLEVSKDDSLMKSLLEVSVGIAQKHPGDEQIQIIADEIGQ